MSMFRRTARIAALGLMAGALAVTTTTPAHAASYSEGFDNVAALTSWKVVNLSDPTDVTEDPSWLQGDPENFTAQSGADNSYIGVDYSAGADDVSAWLISPLQTSLSSTDALSFWTRSAGTEYPDRMEVRMSTNGSCSPGTTTAGVGDFTTVLGSINPDQALNGYPAVWTQYNLPLVGLNTTNVSGCVAFRYFISDTGDNGQYVGVDSLSFTDNASTACTTAQSSAAAAQAQVTTAAATVATTTQAVTKAKKVLKKAKKKLKKARKADATEKRIKKLKKKVRKAKKALKRARTNAAAAATALTTAQAALAAAQASTTSSCP